MSGMPRVSRVTAGRPQGVIPRPAQVFINNPDVIEGGPRFTQGRTYSTTSGHTFKITGLAGEGSCGYVFTAEDRLGNVWALKIPRIKGTNYYRMVSDEGTALRTLDKVTQKSENLLAFHSTGNLYGVELVEPGGRVATNEQVPFVAMQYIENARDLHEEINTNGTLAPLRALDFALQLCRTLKAADAKEVAHRDIKPENIFLRVVNGKEVVILNDFGLSGIKNNYGLAGTLAFMSPQQMLGEELDRRDDIYQLVATLYAFLAGEAPFGEGNELEPTAVTYDKILRAKALGMTTRLQGVSGSVNAIFARGLAPKRSAGYQDYKELEQALLEAIAEQKAFFPEEEPLKPSSELKGAAAFCDQQVVWSENGQLYQIEDFIGVGSEGAVYYAEEVVMPEDGGPIEPTGKYFALKVPVPGAEVLLEKEASACSKFSKLDHDGLPAYQDNGQLYYNENGVQQQTAFLATGYMEGVDLNEFLESEDRFGLYRSLVIFGKVAKALAAAAKEGELHRDLKPQNIRVDFDLEDRITAVRVFDFGLSDLTNLGELSELEGEPVGTPGYMAPEQATGAFTVASDIYALGAILHQMLSGEVPFEQSVEGEAETDSEVIRYVKRQVKGLPRIQHLPIIVNEFIQKLTAVNPAERPQSYTQLAVLFNKLKQNLKEHGRLVSKFEQMIEEERERHRREERRRKLLEYVAKKREKEEKQASGEPLSAQWLTFRSHR